MAGYQIVAFGDVNLPLYNAQQALDAAPAASSLAPTIGGTFDLRGSRRAFQPQQQIEISGLYYGEAQYLADHAGNLLIDHAGNLLVAANGPGWLRQQLDRLRAKIGSRDSLWRERMDDGKRQWRTARLLGLAHPSDVADRMVRARVTARFELATAAWRAAAPSSVAATVTAAKAGVVRVHNGGNVRVEDATLTVMAAGTITSIAVTAAGIDLAWTGSLAAGQALVVDAGAMTVRKAGVDAYSGFAVGSGHTEDGWLPIEVGNSAWTVTANGSATATLQFYDQFL